VLDVAVRAEAAGYSVLAANDHLVYGRPWLDGPSALAAAAARTSTIRLMTSVALPVVRGPVPLAKALMAIDRLSSGRLTAGVGPGSSARDYAVAGIPFEERWPRFDEAVQALRALVGGGEPFHGRFYDTGDLRLEPAAYQPGGPPLWLGSWGSEAGVARVARLADGWLASGYNATPAQYAEARARLDEQVAAAGRSRLPSSMVTMWTAITDDAPAGRHVLETVLAPMLGRPLEALDGMLLVGEEAAIVDRVAAYEAAGVEELVLWPVIDEIRQIERFAERIAPSFGRP
jgi:alkanesulfonate monooxygenase SsuD/methylene tetrahydromethanopterin reductase-like flavin-dependent oxidoreductase (luciferase family)